MAKILWRAGTLMAPVPPVLISCGTMEKPNVMTAAWTGVLCSDPTLVYVSIRPSRYSYELISQSKEFVINLPTVALAKQVDLCGVKSGRTVDKFKLSGLTPAVCTKVSAPQVLESPISLECRVLEIKHLETADGKGSHDMFLAEVLAVNVDEAYIDENNALHLEKAGLLAYAHGFYYALGKQIGKFGWSVEKDSTKRKRVEQEKNKKAEKKEKSEFKTKQTRKRVWAKHRDFEQDDGRRKSEFQPRRPKSAKDKNFNRGKEKQKTQSKIGAYRPVERKAPRKTLTLKK